MPAGSTKSSKHSRKGGVPKAPNVIDFEGVVAAPRAREKIPDAEEVYDSIGAAAAALNIPIEVLKRAKRQGAAGFRGSRVYPKALLPWLEANGGLALSKIDAVKLRRAEKELEDLEYDMAVKRGQYVKRAECSAWATDLVANFLRVLDAVPCSLAPDIVGCQSIPEIEKRIRAALGAVKLALHKNPWAGRSAAGTSPE